MSLIWLTLDVGVCDQAIIDRCFIETSYMTEEIISTFRMPFVQQSGEYDIRLITCAYEEGGKAEIFMDIEPVKRAHLQNQLEQCGGGQVLIHSFPSTDPSHLQGKFLGRVLAKANTPGIKSYQRGYTSSNVFPVSGLLGLDPLLIYEELKAVQDARDQVCCDFSFGVE
jgi:hypothetical protein